MELTGVKKMAVLGAALGLIGSAVMMIPNEKEADAAIVVMDEQNIAEAIKTAITTAEMLDKETQQLLLAILNTKTLNADVLLKYVQGSKDATDNICGTADVMQGMLKGTDSAQNYLKNEVGDVEGILNGNITLADVYMNHQKSMSAAAKVSEDAAYIAKEAQKQTIVEANTLDQALKDSNNAEGQLQAIQAGNQIAAIAARTEMRNSNSLGGLISMMATRMTREAADEAYIYKEREETLKNMREYLDN